VASSGLRGKPGVPQTGWQRREGPIDFGEPCEICGWCGREIRYVSVMIHSGWPDSVRVGGGCATRMRGWGMLVGTFLQNLWPAIVWLVIIVVIGLLVL
jgi:hypothetical protein